MDMIQYAGLWMLALWTLNMWAWLSVLGSGNRLVGLVFWTFVLVALPGLGFIAWYLLGPRRAAI